MAAQVELNRSISLTFMVMYGLGTMVGGGIYALVGKVAAESLMYAPVAMLLSGLFALVTGLSYAELTARYPVSAGEVRYVEEGFGVPWLGGVVGIMVILTGIVSSAALSVATIGFLQAYVAVPETLSIVILVVVMGIIAGWGVGASVLVVSAITIVEIGGLVYVVVMAGTGEVVWPEWNSFVPPLELEIWLGIFSGAFLAFYAFIGFEDMANMAEEVKDVERTLPVAIIVSIAIAILLYVVITVIAVSTVSPDVLARSKAPIADIARQGNEYAGIGLWLVSLLTGLNGALVQVIMSSRVAYGSARRGLAPAWLGQVNSVTRTPLNATVVIVLIITMLAIFFPLATLAKVTSGIILLVFGAVNLSLWIVKRRDPVKRRLPEWVPLAGALGCAVVLVFQLWLLV